ncbi:bile acid:sodium symporter family protein [Neobacillus cucumis]|nr:bile acid:sodium symporter family protein [Neobacillus cucumis]
MKTATFVIARLMPLWIVAFAAWAIFSPELFSPLSGYTSLALSFVLLIMGLTLDLERLIVLIQKPKVPLVGSAGKWVIATVVSVIVGYLFFSSTQFFAGVVMAGIVPSGTSANLNTLIAKGDLALSVTMSAVDTLIGPLLTPALAKFFIGSSVHFDYFSFVWKMTKIVFLPLIVGIFIQYKFPKLQQHVKPAAPIFSSVALYIVVLGIASQASIPLLAHPAILPSLFLCVSLQIILQMMLGYFFAKVLRYDEAVCRSIVFEVGICNSALATVLANDAFGPLAGLAAMANMVCNLTLGSLLAAVLASIPFRTSLQKVTYHKI